MLFLLLALSGPLRFETTHFEGHFGGVERIRWREPVIRGFVSLCL